MILIACILLSISIPSIIKYKIGMVLSFQVIGMLVQFEIWSLYSAFPEFPIFANDETLSIQRTIFLLAQAFTILFMSLVYGNQKICLRELSDGILFALDVFSLFSISVCTLVWQIAQHINRREVYYVSLMVVFLSIGNFYIFLYLIMNISKSIKEMLIKQRTIMILEERSRSIEEVNEKFEYISKIKHNLKHRIVSLWHAFESGEKESIKKNLKEMNIEVDAIDNNIYTKNLVINSILRYEFGRAKQKGISLNCVVDVPNDFDLEKGNLCDLLGNILDNAYEASLKIPVEKRFIDFSCRIVNKTLIIKAENGKDVNEVVTFKTSKQNKKEHGYGLQSVIDIIKKYSGKYKIVNQESSFLIICTLNIAKYLSK